MADGISAGSLYFELGDREQDLAALGQSLSEKLNPKQPSKGGYSGLIKELDQLQAKLREGKISQKEFDDGLEQLKTKATPTTTELKKLANETRGLRNEGQATGQNTKQVGALKLAAKQIKREASPIC